MPSKEAETQHLESFLRAQPELGLALDKVDPYERPDFIARMGNRRIGIEVTRYSPLVQPGAPRPDEQDSLRSWTMELAREAYQETEGPPLNVDAIFKSYPPLTKQRAPKLANEIANFLLSRSPELITLYRSAAFDYRSGENFLPELAALNAFRVPTEAHGVWYDGQGTWVRHAEESDVVRTVLVKERHVPQYRQQCEELWLLIVFDLLAADTHVAPPATPVAFTVRTSFDRVFCLAPAGDRCVEVPILPTAAE